MVMRRFLPLYVLAACANPVASMAIAAPGQDAGGGGALIATAAPATAAHFERAESSSSCQAVNGAVPVRFQLANVGNSLRGASQGESGPTMPVGMADLASSGERSNAGARFGSASSEHSGSGRISWAQMAGDADASGSAARNPHLQSIGLSILLPGLAQYRMGHKLRASAYFAAEAACWSAFTTFRIQGSNREDSYQQMAELFAGVQNAGSRNEDYYEAIGGWPSSELYNEIVVRREAREEHGDDLAAREAYYESNKIQGDEEWTWVSEAARFRYRDKRSDAERAFKNSRNMIGLAVANRVVAMIDAVLLERRHSSLRVELVPDPGSRGARVSISRAVP